MDSFTKIAEANDRLERKARAPAPVEFSTKDILPEDKIKTGGRPRPKSLRKKRDKGDHRARRR